MSDPVVVFLEVSGPIEFSELRLAADLTAVLAQTWDYKPLSFAMCVCVIHRLHMYETC